jgi:serine/threonine protein kinase
VEGGRQTTQDWWRIFLATRLLRTALSTGKMIPAACVLLHNEFWRPQRFSEGRLGFDHTGLHPSDRHPEVPQALQIARKRNSTMFPSVGEQFRQYRILSKAGEGGMSVVFRAQDIKLGRDIALKFLTRIGHLDSGEAERLRLKARSLAALNHANSVAIFDIDKEDARQGPELRCVGHRRRRIVTAVAESAHGVAGGMPCAAQCLLV